MSAEVAVSRPVETDAILIVEPAYSSYELATRGLDILIAGMGLLLSLPIIAILAFLIRQDSPGGALFRQRRLGRGGRLFTFYKFRTMYIDARERFPAMYEYAYAPDEIQTMYFKVIHDPRLTSVGARLRKTSLDEIPNLINVLKGDMTLVGPRPEIPEMVRYYEPHQMAKFSLKPGLTGLAQVSGRAILRFQETLAADLEYVRRRSFWLDVRILLRTVVVVLLRVGAF